MIGIGYDMHQLKEGESLYLGGIKIDSDLGTVAHSDGDVLLHSIIDAMLGAAGLGDIGEHFPDTDDKYKNFDSKILFTDSLKLINNEGYNIVNLDVTIITEKPKINPLKQRLKESIANLAKIDPKRVNIKATTNEKRGFIGRLEGIAVLSACLLSMK